MPPIPIQPNSHLQDRMAQGNAPGFLPSDNAPGATRVMCAAVPIIRAGISAEYAWGFEDCFAGAVEDHLTTPTKNGIQAVAWVRCLNSDLRAAWKSA